MNAVGLMAVGVGAVLGAWLRWALSLGLNTVFSNLPLGTLIANLAGGFVIGVAIEAFLQHPVIAPEIRLFLITGFLGSLTTFSTFSVESVAMLQRGDYQWAALHIFMHLAGSLAMTVLGMMTMRSFGVQ